MEARNMLRAVWAVALIGLACWTLLAWGTGALVSGGSDWLGLLADRVIDSAAAEARVGQVLQWVEAIGRGAVWLLWIAGSLGLLLTAGFATRLLGHARDRA